MAGNARLLSIDALRGLNMLLIMGVGTFVLNLCIACGWGADCTLARQFEHVEWHGLRIEDVIFPLFLFLAGVSWPFSCSKQLEKGVPRRRIALKCLRRMLLLCLLGWIYEGLLDGELRMGSVLGRIGLAWFCGALLYLFCRVGHLCVLAIALPVGYWLLLAFCPAPDALTLAVPPELAFVREYGTGPFSTIGNLSGWVDRTFMPGVLRPYTGIADNQSALGVIPAVGTALLGVLAGELIRRTQSSGRDVARVGALLGMGAALIALGLVIANGFGEYSMPINKKLWSASFTFVVGGCSVLLLALFHWVVDVRGWVRWTFFFRVIGMNSITIYLARRFIPFDVIAANLFGGLARALPEAWGQLVLSACVIGLGWLFLYFLYRQKVFLRV